MPTRLTVLCLLACLVLGCSSRGKFAPPPRDKSKDVLIHLPGITGELGIDREFVRGIKMGGFQGEVTIVDWTDNDPGLGSLFADKRHVRQAAMLAERIEQVRRDNPCGRLIVSAHSGGNGIAVWALERLPADVHVDDVLLLSPALSPDYDLSKALRHVDGHVYAFTSPYDFVVLGVGTMLFRTIDGKRTDSAGRVGFVRPPGADPDQYGKLVAKPYQAAWMKYGNIGDHIGVLSKSFVASVLAPLVVPPDEVVKQPEPEPPHAQTLNADNAGG
jgi:hypothetical protein